MLHFGPENLPLISFQQDFCKIMQFECFVIGLIASILLYSDVFNLKAHVLVVCIAFPDLNPLF